MGEDEHRVGWITAARFGFRLALSESRRSFVITAVVSVVAAGVAPLSVLWTKRLIDQIASATAENPARSHLIGTAIVLGVLAGLRGLSSVAANQQTLLSRDITHSAEQRFFAAVSDVEMSRMDDSNWYDRVARVSDELPVRPGLLVGVLIQLLSGAVGVLGILGVLLSLHPALMALALCAALPTLFGQRYVTGILYALRRDVIAGQREKSYLADLLCRPFAQREVRAYSLADELLRRRDEIDLPLRERVRRLITGTHLVATLGGVISGVSYTAAYAFVSVSGTSGRLSIGSLAAVITAFAQVSTLLSQLVGSLGQLDQQSQLFLRDYFAITSSERQVSAPSDLPACRIERLVFADVTFRYPSSEVAAIESLSLDMRAGELVALVGDNGAGKSTLVRLLLGFYAPSNGTISINGEDIRGMDQAEMRSRIAVLFQDFVQYELTALSNVTFGRPDHAPDKAAAQEATSWAQADRFISRLPRGIDNRVGKMFAGGHDLSGGEWQRLALARFKYRNADIWVLDEPGSALDPGRRGGLIQKDSRRPRRPNWTDNLTQAR